MCTGKNPVNKLFAFEMQAAVTHAEPSRAVFSCLKFGHESQWNFR